MITFVFVLLAFVYYLYNFYRKTATLPPGPTALPIIGNLHLLDHDRPDLSLNALARKHGGMCTVYMGPHPLVVITDNDLLREALLKNG